MPDNGMQVNDRTHLRNIVFGYCDAILKSAGVSEKKRDKALIHLMQLLKSEDRKDIEDVGGVVAAEIESKLGVQVGRTCLRKCTDPQKSLGARYPHLVKEWDTKMNGGITAYEVYPNSNFEAHWRCAKGHTWTAAVFNRSSGNTRCPYCYGKRAISGKNDIVTLDPELARHWDYELNAGVDPRTILLFSITKVWWRCDCGNVWKKSVKIEAMNQTHRCQECKKNKRHVPRE